MAWDTGSKHIKLFRRSRTQLTVWYTGVIAIVLSLSGLGMYEAISHAHRVTADRELKAVAETVRTVLKNDLSDNGLIDSFPDSLMPNLCLAESNCLTSLEEVRPLSANTNHQNNFYFVLLNPNEEPIAIAGNFPEGVPIFNPASSIIVLRDKQGNSYRQIAISLNSQNGQTPMGTLFVGRSFSDFATYLDMILWIVVLSLTLTTGVIAFASWWLAGLAIKPVEFAYRQIQDFTADAAHELRTPLSAVRATAESVVRLPQISEIEAREALQVISRQNQRLANLVSDLLLLSRLDTQPPPPFSQCCLQDLLSDIEEEMAALAIANNIHLKLNQFKTTRITVMGNEDHLYRLILNVVSNALQHTPDDGEVSILLHQIGGSAWITVQDSGVGISLEDQKRIFDRFYRVDKNRSRRGGGSGLGLSIAKAIAQTHNGTLSVSSELKKGSTFSICLPVSNK